MSWFVLIVLAPLLPTPVSALVYAFGSFICHQRPDRSFFVGEAQLPVCARCLGIYGGATAGSLIAPFLGRIAWPRTAVILSVVPALGSLVVEWTGLARPSNEVRAATGVVAGMIIAAVVLATLNYERCARPQRIVPNPPPTPI